MKAGGFRGSVGGVQQSIIDARLSFALLEVGAASKKGAPQEEARV